MNVKEIIVNLLEFPMDSDVWFKDKYVIVGVFKNTKTGDVILED